MGERKTLNKYYPPDFDPSKIPRRRRAADHPMKVRMMLPMRIRCRACGNYMSLGTKINSLKQKVIGQNYLGIQIFRFNFKCSTCSGEMRFLTDPKNSDYTVELGAKRCYESGEEKEKKPGREDALKSLENRTADSKREMDIVTALDELKSMKSRRATVSVDDMLQSMQQRTKQDKEKRKIQLELDGEDEALIGSVFKERPQLISDEGIVDDDYKEKRAEGVKLSCGKRPKSLYEGHVVGASPFQVQIKPKPTTISDSRVTKTTNLKSNSNGVLLLCQQYDTEDSE